MIVKLLSGAAVHITTALIAAKNVTAMTNAVEVVLTSIAYGLVNDGLMLLKSGWGKLNERVFRVSGVATDTFKLAGIDTTNADNFPAGSGGDTVRKIIGRTNIPQIIEFSTSDGEQQYVDFGFLEDDYEQQIPSTQSAMSTSIKVTDDPNLDGYGVTIKASNAGTQTLLKTVLENGGQVVYNGYSSLNKTPEMIRNQLMAITLSYMVSDPINRY